MAKSSTAAKQEAPEEEDQDVEELVKEEPHGSEQDKERGQKSKRKTRSQGMDLDGIHPKQAVKEFLQKYFVRDIYPNECYYVTEDSMGLEVDGQFQYEEGKYRFKAKLHVPILDMVFQGGWCDSPKGAEVSAAEQFVADDFVREVAPLLPIPIKVIKCWIRHHHKNSTNEQIREMAHREYNAQRNLGCRTALWDGIA